MASVATADVQGELELDLPIETASRRLTPARIPAWLEEPIVVAGRVLEPTPVFDSYWYFAAERQAIYQARVSGKPGPWTTDSVMLRHRFTNCYRAADRVSQFLIRQVSYRGSQRLEEVVFRTLLFKMFNRVSTWQLLEEAFGDVSWERFDLAAYDEVLTTAFAGGQKLYSAAYVVPPPRLGAVRKHTNHLRLLDLMMTTGLPQRADECESLRDLFSLLVSYPAMGNFLAYQFAIDLNYSAIFGFDEMEFVVPGPGARDGVRKCFGRQADGIEADLIRYMCENQDHHFSRLGLEFEGLRGRPLQLVDCQNLFCEVDKYARVVHPDILGHSGRSRIKQLFAPVSQPVTDWFPPKWGINERSSN